MPETLKIPLLDFTHIDQINFKEDEYQSLIPNLESAPIRELHHLFHINRIESYIKKMTLPVPPHRKNVSDCIFLTKGHSVRTKGIDKYRFGKNQFFFLPAQQISSHEFISDDAEGYFIHFSHEIFHTLSFRYLKNLPFLDLFGNPVVTIPDQLQQTILNIFLRLESIYKNFCRSDLDIVSWYIMALMTEAKRYIREEKGEKKNSASEITKNYKNLLSRYIYEKQSVNDYADMLNVSPNHLNKCVRQVLKKTAQALLKEMIIVEAKFLLRYSNLSTSEISYKLCDQTPSNFIRFFKQQTGITPKDFINQSK